MFARIVNEYQIDIAPRCIHVGNKTYVLPTPEQYAEAGYYKVFGEEGKPPRKWYHLVEKYKLEKNHIIQYYIEEKDDKPDRTTLIVNKIRKQYSINDELAILRQKDNGAKKQEDFQDYNNFCEECKVEADKEIEEWGKA